MMEAIWKMIIPRIRPRVTFLVKIFFTFRKITTQQHLSTLMSAVNQEPMAIKPMATGPKRYTMSANSTLISISSDISIEARAVNV